MAQAVRDYVAEHPTVQEALAMGIINHSALAQRIMDDQGLDKPDAVLKALTRIDVDEPGNGDAVRSALASARLEVRTRVAMMTCDPSWQLLEALARRARSVVDDDERIHILHGWDALTVVAHEAVLDEVRSALPSGQEHEHVEGLAELNVRTREPLDGVPGFIAYAARALADRGIAVLDATTCRRDHIFLIRQADLADAVDAMEAAMAG